jgi:hypothetical protein
VIFERHIFLSESLCMELTVKIGFKYFVVSSNMGAKKGKKGVCNVRKVSVFI